MTVLPMLIQKKMQWTSGCKIFTVEG